MNLNKKLEVWVQNKLISSTQQKSIVEFETRQKKPMFLYSLLFLSSFCIGLGVIAVIASNWQMIPPSLKLLVDFLLLAMVGGGAFYARINNRSALTETLLIIYAVLVLASIGLIAQIFQLPSNGGRALLFWSVIISPLLLFSRQPWISFFWLPICLISLFDTLLEIDWFRNRIETFIAFFPGAISYFQLFLFVVLYRLLSASRAISHPITSAFRWWAILFLVVYVLTFDIMGRELFYPSLAFYDEKIVPDVGFYKLLVWLGLALLTGAFCLFNLRKNGKYWALVLFILLDYALIAQLLPNTKLAFGIWGALQTLSVLGLCAVYAYNTSRPALLNWMSALMALRFFIIYIQVFGSLLTTGMGLIISGVVFLALAYGWYKIKNATALTGEAK